MKKTMKVIRLFGIEDVSAFPWVVCKVYNNKPTLYFRGIKGKDVGDFSFYMEKAWRFKRCKDAMEAADKYGGEARSIYSL